MTGRRLRDETVRQCLGRLREKFAEFLVDELRALLRPEEQEELVDRDTFHQELHDLRLLGYLSGLAAAGPPEAGEDGAHRRFCRGEHRGRRHRPRPRGRGGGPAGRARLRGRSAPQGRDLRGASRPPRVRPTAPRGDG
jgi:hypothetical protein